MDPGSGGHRADRSRQSSHVEANSYVGVKSHYAGVDMEPAVELYFFPGGYVGIAPVAAGTVNVAALLRRSFAGGAGHAGGSVPALLAAAARAHPQLARRLAEAQPLPGTQAAVAPVAPGRAPAAAWGGLPLVGDAALMVPPLCGDGMSIALRSACLCAPLADRCLRGAITPAQWERQYALLLRRELAGPLRWGGLLQTLAEGRLAPRLLLRAAHLWPGLAAALVRATRLRDAGGGPDAR